MMNFILGVIVGMWIGMALTVFCIVKTFDKRHKEEEKE